MRFEDSERANHRHVVGDFFDLYKIGALQHYRQQAQDIIEQLLQMARADLPLGSSYAFAG